MHGLPLRSATSNAACVMQPSSPAEQSNPGCSVKAIAIHQGLVYVALASTQTGQSDILCANTGQRITVPSQVETMVVRSLGARSLRLLLNARDNSEFVVTFALCASSVRNLSQDAICCSR
jgi:hypothetical protein